MPIEKLSMGLVDTDDIEEVENPLLEIRVGLRKEGGGYHIGLRITDPAGGPLTSIKGWMVEAVLAAHIFIDTVQEKIEKMAVAEFLAREKSAREAVRRMQDPAALDVKES